MITSIAWKNVWRNKTRSLVVIFAVIFGMFGGIFSSAVMTGMVELRIKKALQNEVPHILIRHKDFVANKELKYYINNADSIIEIVKGVEGVKNCSRRTDIIAMANTAKAASGVMVFGVDTMLEKKVCMLYKTICDTCGNYLTKSNQIVIGKRLASKIKAKVKSKIVLTLQSTDGNLTGGVFRVAGIFETKNAAFDEGNVYLLNSSLCNLINFDENNAHEISVMIKNLEELDNIQASIKAKLPNNYEVVTWKQLQPETAGMSDMMDVMLYITIGIILLALGFGIINTMLMAVLERVKELGMLMAIGMNKLKVFKMIMFETIMLTLTGGAIGLVVTYFIVLYYGHVGLDLGFLGSGYEAFGFDSVINPKLDGEFYFVVTILVILTGVLASIYPALKALKLNPVEAIRADN